MHFYTIKKISPSLTRSLFWYIGY